MSNRVVEEGAEPHKRGRSNVLIGILIVAFLLRLGTLLFALQFNPDYIYSNDSPSYIAPAVSVLDEGAFHEKLDTDTPMYVRTPGYPLFIAAAFTLFDRSVWGLLFIQVCIGVATVLVTYSLCRYLWNENVAVIAAFLMAIGPLQLVSCAKILTECLHGFVLMCFALVAVRILSRKESSLSLWFLAGLLLAASTHVRPVTYYFLVLFLPLLVWRLKDTGIVSKPAIARFFLLLLPILLLIGGWSFRNWKAVGSWRFSGIEAVNMYFYRGAGVIAETGDRSAEEVRNQFRAEFGEPGKESQGSYYSRMYQKGVDLLKNHPRELIVITVKGLISEVFGVRSPIFYFYEIPQKTIWILISQTILVAVYLFACAGMIEAFRNSPMRFAHLFCAAMIFYILFVSAGPEANARFRTPVMPFLSLYAGAGLWFTASRLVRNRRQPASNLS